MLAVAPREIPPALEAAKPVQSALKRLRAAQARLEDAELNFKATRRQTVQELLAQGLSYGQIAGLLGVTKSRAFQIARGE